MVKYSIDEFESAEWGAVGGSIAWITLVIVLYQLFKTDGIIYGNLTDVKYFSYHRIITHACLFISGICAGFGWAFQGFDFQTNLYFGILYASITLFFPVFMRIKAVSYYITFVGLLMCYIIWVHSEKKTQFLILPMIASLQLLSNINLKFNEF